MKNLTLHEIYIILMKFISAILFAFSPLFLLAQDFNEMFRTSSEIQAEDSNKVFFRIENANFFKNNEYFGVLEDGYTTLGSLLKPSFVYYPSSKSKLQAGVHLLKYFGTEKISQVYPVFSFQVNVVKGLDVLLGSLYSGYNHGLIEPLYKPERHFENNWENGVQILTRYARIKSDIWLNWEKFILPGDPFKEEFTVGTNTQIFLNDTASDFVFSIPVQGIFTHKGGQIDAAKDEPLESLTNLAGGISFLHKIKSDFINSWGVNGMYVASNDISHTKLQPYISGYGIFSEAWINTKYVNLFAAYWDGNYFIAPRGEPLYSSVSVKDKGIFVPHNQLLTGKIGLKKKVHKDITIEVRFEGYYELYDKNFDYSYGIHITFNRNFFLKKINLND
ncbi:MAG: hypothetical protein A2491_09760 [Bacteroidetes bacterium RIFOXYC12_FULL_35_7]|nr:MAG: hypothetical protein A2491_09760 [Bacteroidetes bacterium RIFOXYC12_FULL_35_7]